MEEIIGQKFVRQNQDAQFFGLFPKLWGIYFSSQWCPPCQNFTPVLIDFYNEVNSGDLDPTFEIVYVSFDHNKEEFEAARNLMPWVCVPFGDKRIADISKRFNTIGIPHLVILNNDGEVVIQNARMDVQAKGYNAFDEWVAKTQKQKMQTELS